METVLKYVEDEIRDCEMCLADAGKEDEVYLLAVHARMIAFLEIRNLVLGLEDVKK